MPRRPRSYQRAAPSASFGKRQSEDRSLSHSPVRRRLDNPSATTSSVESQNASPLLDEVYETFHRTVNAAYRGDTVSVGAETTAFKALFQAAVQSMEAASRQTSASAQRAVAAAEAAAEERVAAAAAKLAIAEARLIAAEARHSAATARAKDTHTLANKDLRQSGVAEEISDLASNSGQSQQQQEHVMQRTLAVTSPPAAQQESMVASSPFLLEQPIGLARPLPSSGASLSASSPPHKATACKPVCAVSSFESAHKAAVQVARSLVDLVLQGPDSPAAWIRNLGRSWESGGASITYRVNVDASFEECWSRFLAIEELEYQDGPDAMLSYLNFAVTYRSCSLKASTSEKAAFQKAAAGLKHQLQFDDRLRIGVNVLHMAFAISQRSLFGVWVLCMLGLTPSKIAEMTQDEIITFIYVVGSHSGDDSSGASSRLVHPSFAPLVDVLVKGFLTALERALVFNMKHCYDDLADVFKKRLMPPSGDDLNFGMRTFGMDGTELYVRMPSADVVQGFKVAPGGLVTLCDGQVTLPLDVRSTNELPEVSLIDSILSYQRLLDLDRSHPRFVGTRRRMMERVCLPEGMEPATYKGLVPHLAVWAGFHLPDPTKEPNYSPFYGVFSQSLLDDVASDAALALPYPPGWFSCLTSLEGAADAIAAATGLVVKNGSSLIEPESTASSSGSLA